MTATLANTSGAPPGARLEALSNRLAHNYRSGEGPPLLFLPGYGSDMSGSKAVALDAWAANRGRAYLRFDYRGCGADAARFEQFTLEDWLDDALAALDALAGSAVVIGSSMGGWLMLHLALRRPERVAALVGIAAAPDFTEWDFDPERRHLLFRDGFLAEASPYGGTTVTTKRLWESGQRLLVLDQAPLPISCPVRLLHGQADPDVPWELSLRLAAALGSPDVQVTLVKDGDHRLSRPQDVALLTATLDQLLGNL